MNNPQFQKQKSKTPLIVLICFLTVLCIALGSTVLFLLFRQPTEAPNNDDNGSGGEFDIISIEPSETIHGFMSTSSDFIVRAVNATADLVRQHILISSAPEYTVTEIAKDEYKVSVKGNFDSGKTVSVQFVDQGSILNSWAFDTETKLEVCRHYPNNNAYGVGTNSVIEIEMTLETKEKPEEYISIFPETDGKWEQIGRVFRFTPSTFLSENTDYTVTVAPGMTAEGLKMESTCSFTFHTYQLTSSDVSISSITFDGINYYRPGEPVSIRYSGYSGVKARSVELYDLSSAENMIAYATGNKSVKMTQLPTPAFTTKTLNNENNQNLIIDPIDAGYYCAKVYFDNGLSKECLLCVNPVNAYVCSSGTDVLVWTESAGISVKYKELSAVTDGNGLAIIKDAIADRDTLEYVYIGDKDQPLVVALKDINDRTYPDCYVYTDKPKYKTSDKIRIWGCIPTELFYKVDPAFSVELTNNGRIVKNVIVEPDENGTFSAEISFENIESCDWSYVSLLANGNSVASKTFIVDDYELQNYTFSFSSEKNYVIGGNKYEFDILVHHVSGVTVSDKRVRVNYNGTDYYATSDKNGIAHFSIMIPRLAGDKFQQELRYRPVIELMDLNVYNGDIEEQAADMPILTQYFYLIKYDKNVWVASKNDVVTFQTRNVNTDGIKQVIVESTGYPQRYNIESGYFETTGTAKVILTKSSRTRIGETFDSYTNTYVPKYSNTQQTTEILDVLNFKTSNGKIEVDLSGYSIRESTEFVCYNLKVEFEIDIKNNWASYYNHYLESNYFKSAQSTGGSSGYSSTATSVRYNSPVSDPAYSVYEYSLSIKETSLDAGETAEITAYQGTESPITDGKLLRILFNDTITETKVFSAQDNISFTVTEEHLPLVSVTCAYYKDGRFYRMPIYDIVADSTKREIEIKAEPTKEKYGPGDEITVNIKTTDKNGAPISCSVNLSIVNDAVFGGETEYLPLGLTMLEYNRSLHHMYTFSTYRNYDLDFFEGGGKGGADGSVRKNFADTACFETVVTDKDGNAAVTFTLPDNITTYRMTTHAASGKYYYGTNVDTFEVSSEFFLQSTAPRGQKDIDDFVANANTITDANGEVTFLFEILETKQSMTVKTAANTNTSANFGKLSVGEYTMKVTAEMGGAKDAVEYKFEVISSGLSAPVEKKLDTSKTTTITPTSFPVILDVYSKSTAQYLEYLEYLQTNDKDRLDKIIASHLSYSLQNELLGQETPPSLLLDTDEFRDDDYVSTMLRKGSSDVILTAFEVYFGTRSPYTDSRSMQTSNSPRSIAESLLLDTINGKSVLFNLKRLEYADGNDDYSRILTALSYAIAGDYNNARKLYEKCDKDYSDRGYRSLYACVATFIDKENAKSIIDDILSKNESDYYLPFAVLLYIKNRGVQEMEAVDVTLAVNNDKHSFKLNPLEIKTLVLYDDGTGKLDLSFKGKQVAACVRYNDIETVKPTSDFSVSLQNYNQKYDVAELVIDLSHFTGQSTRIDIVLPPSLRVSSARNLKGYAYLSAKREKLTVYTTKKTASAITIPLVVANSGDYTLESVKLTDTNGNIYYSTPINFKIN